MNAVRPVPVIDALLAATAKANGLTLVTRNVADVGGIGRGRAEHVRSLNRDCTV